MTLLAEVSFPLPLDQTFFYKVPDSFESQAKIGSRVLAPFGERTLTGFIINLRKRKPKEEFKLKEIREVLDEKPVFTHLFLSFTRKLSEYYYSSWGEILQAALPPSFILKSKMRISLSEKAKEALQKGMLSTEEKEIVQLLEDKSYSPLFLKKKCRVKNFSSLLSRMENKGLVEIQREMRKVKRKREAKALRRETQLEFDFSLDDTLQPIADIINRKMEEKVFSPFLLYGPQDLREAVYFFLIKKVLAQSEKVLFLVPEISIGKALIEKFEKRFGERVAILHSQLSERKRELEWQKIRNREADVVVGPRSALFSPIEKLRLVIVDDEHDESYYQQESPSYDARRGAWLRAREEKATLVCGSAMPSVEAFYQAKKNGYLLSLETRKRKSRVSIVEERGGREIISRKLREGIRGRLVKGEPVLFFFNRRGYASYFFCSRCNYIPKCIHCDIVLTYHKREEKLVCHYCNYSLPKVEVCPNCGSRLIGKRGAGIEAVEEELKRNFPQARITCFDRDVTKSKKEQGKILQDFRKGKIDILVGTELLAHQIDLPSFSFIGILSPETMLTLSDYRASQRTFQTLTRMTSFLRDESHSEVMIQTALPHHFSIRQAAFGDYVSFYNQEIKFRRIMNYPPFSHMVEVLFMGENLRNLAQKSREFSTQVKSLAEDIEILGPALASVSKMRGLRRIQVILKARERKDVRRLLREYLKKIRLRKSILVLG